MRFYELSILDPSGQVWQADINGLGFSKQDASWGPTFSSLYTPWILDNGNSNLLGQPNPSALQIAFDLPIAALHTLQGPANVQVWGLGLQALGHAADLNPVLVNGSRQFKTWTLRAGMSSGLPLANPAQQGILASGIVWQSYGLWEGVEQTLNLILQNGTGPTADPAITWIWKKGQNLQGALQQMFAQAFPASSVTYAISSNLVAPSDIQGCYVNVGAFAKDLLHYTKALGAQSSGSTYPGVSIIPAGATFNVTDGTQPPKTTALAFQDLVGQPTWLAAYTVTFATVMRGDINVGDRVTFPAGILPPYALTTPDAAFPGTPAASSTAFQGPFQIQELHHYGSFKEPDAGSWSTVFVAFATQTS